MYKNRSFSVLATQAGQLYKDWLTTFGACEIVQQVVEEPTCPIRLLVEDQDFLCKWVSYRTQPNMKHDVTRTCVITEPVHRSLQNYIYIWISKKMPSLILTPVNCESKRENSKNKKIFNKLYKWGMQQFKMVLTFHQTKKTNWPKKDLNYLTQVILNAMNLNYYYYFRAIKYQQLTRPWNSHLEKSSAHFLWPLSVLDILTNLIMIFCY